MPFLTRKNSVGVVGEMFASNLRTGTEVPWGDYTYHATPGSADFKSQRGGTSFAWQRVGTCANPECPGGWRAPWKNRRRPIFEGQWGCSGRCILSMVRAAVRREAGDSVASAQPIPHRHRIPLGLLMMAQGWITQEQLRQGLEAQRQWGSGRIGDWLKSECGVGAEQVTRGLSMQWGCPVLATDGFFPEPMALVMPKLFVERFGVLPLRVAGSKILYVGSSQRLDASVALALEQMSALTVESGVIDEAQFESAKGRLLACAEIETRRETAEDNDAMIGRITAVLEQKQPIASRLVRVHQYYWLRMWLEAATRGKAAGDLPAETEDLLDYVFAIGSK